MFRPQPNSMFRLPTDKQHLAIVGQNGSGKTQAAEWHLSHRRFDLMPWVVINWKNDESIDSIPGAYHIELEQVPTQPGIYIVHPFPDDDSSVANLLWEIWKRGGIGVYVDEGYMIGRKQAGRAYRAILTQGRSKYIPTITLSQRPVWMDQFVFSEAAYIQIFRLGIKKDRDKVREFVSEDSMPESGGRKLTLEHRLPDYHSWYYDSGLNKTVIVSPVPAIEVIHSTFQRRLTDLERRQKKVV